MLHPRHALSPTQNNSNNKNGNNFLSQVLSDLNNPQLKTKPHQTHQVQVEKNNNSLTSSAVQYKKQSSPIRSLKLTFTSLDQQNTGFVDKSILTQAIMYTGDNYDKRIIKEEIDKCQDKISLQKFMQIFQLAQIEMNTLLANESLFRMYDRENKGYIDSNDLRRVSSITGIQLSQQQIAEMLGFNLVPGQAQLDEFVEVMDDQNAWF